MRSWQTENPKDKYGVHHADTEAFRLDRDELRRRFRFYIDRFDTILS